MAQGTAEKTGNLRSTLPQTEDEFAALEHLGDDEKSLGVHNMTRIRHENACNLSWEDGPDPPLFANVNPETIAEIWHSQKERLDDTTGGA